MKRKVKPMGADERYEHFTVISGGASRHHLAACDIDSALPVVTVNRAIDVMDSGIDVHFAAFMDPPEQVWDPMKLDRYVTQRLQLWVPMVYAPRWELRLPLSTGFRMLPVGTVDYEFEPNRKHSFTLLSVLERVVMFRPKKIRVFAADMVGSWVEGMGEEECERLQSSVQNLRAHIRECHRNRVKSQYQGAPKQVLDQMDFAIKREEERLETMIKEGEKPFRRWAHERRHLEAFKAKVKETVGVEVEFVSSVPAA